MKTSQTTSHVPFFNAQWAAGWPQVMQSLVSAFIIAIVAFLIWRIAKRIIRRLVTRSLRLKQANPLRIRTMESLLASVAGYTILFIAAVAILGKFGVNTSAIVASAGVVGLAIGFGAQGLVSDVVTGFFVLLEGQVSVGEYVTIGTYSGIVEHVGMRIIELRDFNGDLHYLPNRQITSLSNHSRGNMQALVDITIPNEANVDEAMRIIQTACDKVKEDLPALVDGPNVVGVETLGATNLTIRVVARTENGEQSQVERALRKVIKDALDARS
jgi:moderate conductance mechanosensitive channel